MTHLDYGRSPALPREPRGAVPRGAITDKQRAYLAVLAGHLGEPAPEPTTRYGASLAIDQLRDRLAARG